MSAKKWKTVSSLSEFIDEVMQISDDAGSPYGNIWLRGCRDGSFDLVPGAYRKTPIDEESMVEDFLVSLPIHSDGIRRDSWETYGLMQHYGLPTRLLDWSKSPLAALFFAIDFDEDTLNPAVKPTVWILDPYAMNGRLHGRAELFVPRTGFGPIDDAAFIESFLPEGLRPTSTYKPGSPPAMPVAIEPTFSNVRLIAQAGCFTVHGIEKRPLNELLTLGIDYFRLDIQRKATPEIRSHLDQLGFRADVIYPDLDHLARRVVWERT